MRRRAQAALELGANTIVAERDLARAWLHARDQAGEHLAGLAFGDRVVRTDAMGIVAEWTKEPKTPTLVLCGPNDAGKSVAAARWVGRMRGLWLRADVLGRANWSGGPLADEAAHADNLVVDDLGTDTHRAREHVCAIVIDRHDKGRRTLITTVMPFGDPKLLGVEGDDARRQLAGTLVGCYPASVVTRLALGWRAIGSAVSGRLAPVTLSLDKVRRALEIDRTATRVEYIVAACSTDVTAIDELARLLALDSDALAAREQVVTARWEAELRLLESALADMRRTP